jgi:hypothetical protein
MKWTSRASKSALKTFPVFGPLSFRLSSRYILAQDDFTRAENRATILG